MQQLGTGARIGIVLGTLALIGVSSGICFVVLGTVLPLSLEENAQAAAVATIVFIMLSPLVGILAAILATIIISLYVVVRRPKANLDTLWTKRQGMVVAFLGMLVGLCVAVSIAIGLILALWPESIGVRTF